MGRKVLGCEPIFEALKTLVKGELHTELRSPVGHLAMALGWAPASIIKYLRELYTHQAVEIVHGTKRSIISVKLLKAELPAVLREETAAEKPEEPEPKAKAVAVPMVQPNAEAPAEPVQIAVVKAAAANGTNVGCNGAAVAPSPVASLRRKSIAILVDYENAVRAANGAGFRLSYARLLEELSRRGNVVFAEVFIPPHIGAREMEVRKLWDAGFMVVYCPMRHKDKDAVDQKLELRGRDIVRETTVDEIVIVSEDKDFIPLANYARNFGKSVERFFPSEHRELAGYEDVRELFQRPEVRHWGSAVDIALGKAVAGTPDEQGRADFIRTIVRTIDGIERRCPGNTRHAFDQLLDLVWRLMKNDWQGYSYGIGMAREAMAALVERKIVVKCHTTGMNYSVLTSDKALLDPILAQPIHC